jgi:hypothetical protein
VGVRDGDGVRWVDMMSRWLGVVVGGRMDRDEMGINGRWSSVLRSKEVRVLKYKVRCTDADGSEISCWNASGRYIGVDESVDGTARKSKCEEDEGICRCGEERADNGSILYAPAYVCLHVFPMWPAPQRAGHAAAVVLVRHGVAVRRARCLAFFVGVYLFKLLFTASYVRASPPPSISAGLCRAVRDFRYAPSFFPPERKKVSCEEFEGMRYETSIRALPLSLHCGPQSKDGPLADTWQVFVPGVPLPYPTSFICPAVPRAAVHEDLKLD